MVPGAYILLSPQEEEIHYSAEHSLKRFKPLSDIILLCQGYCWTGKNINKEFSCVMVFIMRPSSTLKLQFIFDFNECLWAIFSLLNIWTFLVLYLACGCMTFDFTTQMTSSHLLPHANEWKTWVQRLPNTLQNVEKDL